MVDPANRFSPFSRRGDPLAHHVVLGPQEVPEGRAFAHPDRTRDDLAALRDMTRALRGLLGAALPGQPPLVVDALSAGGRACRAVVCDASRLRAASDHALVGFFAERRPGLDHGALEAADRELIAEFPRHPGILSYSSLELPDGNWGNLVVLDSHDARERWGESARHAHAVRELAPRHYVAVRLHEGVFPRGLLKSEPALIRTRYYDLRQAPVWCAARPSGQA